MDEQDIEAFSKSTPIKNLNKQSPDEEFGQSTQSILNLCEMMGKS